MINDYNKGKKCIVNQEEKKENMCITIFSYLFAFLFIYCGLVYIIELTIPSIALIMAGIILLPQIRKILNRNMYLKVGKYFIFIALFLIYACGVDSSNVQIDSNSINQETIQEEATKSDSSNEPITPAEPTYENGSYSGEFKDSKRDGKGSFIWKDGTKYEGQWIDDKIEGSGKIVFSQGDSYEGNFENNKMSGLGTYTFKNGDKYTGDFKDDCMSGDGTYSFSNGDVYKGSFSDNKFNGKGTYTKNGKNYTGTWKDNKYSK